MYVLLMGIKQEREAVFLSDVTDYLSIDAATQVDSTDG